MPDPADASLYARVKARVYAEHPAHSAYRSGLLVQRYKKAFRKKHGASVSPYKGRRPTAAGRDPRGLPRWFAEVWRNESGGVGYDRDNTLYRPTVRVSEDTPATWSELTPKQVRDAREEKKSTGRVKRFNKPKAKPKAKPEAKPQAKPQAKPKARPEAKPQANA